MINGQCEAHSQFSILTIDEMTNQTGKRAPYKCNFANFTEMTNGVVHVNFMQRGDPDHISSTYSGYYSDTTLGVMEITRSSFTNGKTKQTMNHEATKGRCEIQRSEGKISRISCLAFNRFDENRFLATSAHLNATQVTYVPLVHDGTPVRPPWFTSNDSTRQCAPSDMSPAERIEWLGTKSIKYRISEDLGNKINGRVQRVTITPESEEHKPWTYFANKATCESSAQPLSQYR